MNNNILISVIIPVYNEAAIAAETATSLILYLDNKFLEKNYEIIFSDDGSTDDTVKIINLIDHPKIRIVSHAPNHGKGSAVRDGMFAANGEIALFTDCDLAYGTEIIGVFYDEMIKTAADAAIGSRRLHSEGYAGYSFLRKLASKIYYKFVSVFINFLHWNKVIVYALAGTLGLPLTFLLIKLMFLTKGKKNVSKTI